MCREDIVENRKATGIRKEYYPLPMAKANK
jgi:hypothetical protein